MTSLRPATVRFYFDADILGLAKIVAQLRSDVTFPGDPGAVVHRRARPSCPIARGVLDDEWIPVVARQGWLIVTRDSRIQRRPAEIEAVRANGARMVALSGGEAKGTWEQLEVLMCRWRSIEALFDEPAPLIRTATRTGLRIVPLS